MTRTLIFVLGIAFGAALYDTQLERHSPLPQTQTQPRSVQYCAPVNAAGQPLSATMVSSAAGTPSLHECAYSR